MGTVSHREQCENCRSMGNDKSGDNRVVYQDGGYTCRACGDCKPGNRMSEKKITKMITDGICEELVERGLKKSTLEKYGVTVAKDRDGTEVIVFPVFKDGVLVKQKIRNRYEKKYTQLGDQSITRLFGQNVFSPSKNVPVIVLEGEFDPLAAHQATTYPAVTGVKGAGGLYKELEANLEWLSGFKHVVLCFDNDEPGRKAANECTTLFEPGFVRVAFLPLKDANDMVLAGREDEFKKCIWNASIIKPDTVVNPADVKELALVKPTFGIDWPWPSLTKITYGLRFGELIQLFGPTGSGKTEITEEIIQCMMAQNVHCGVFSFEQQPEDRLRRMTGKLVNKRLHLPGTDWGDMALIEEKMDWLDGKVSFYDTASGGLSVEKIMINMRYLNKANGTRFFVIDNLKALSVNPYIDGKAVADYTYMSHVVSKMFLLSRELKVTILLINHVRKSDISVSAKVSSYDAKNEWDASEAVNVEGLTWESGRMPGVGDMYGGGNINDLVDYTIAISRNSVSPNPLTKRKIIAKILKSRLDSKYTGYKFDLYYDYETGRLTEGVTVDG